MASVNVGVIVPVKGARVSVEVGLAVRVGVAVVVAVMV